MMALARTVVPEGGRVRTFTRRVAGLEWACRVLTGRGGPALVPLNQQGQISSISCRLASTTSPSFLMYSSVISWILA